LDLIQNAAPAPSVLLSGDGLVAMADSNGGQSRYFRNYAALKILTAARAAIQAKWPAGSLILLK
jgi:hypothetical protein